MNKLLVCAVFALLVVFEAGQVHGRPGRRGREGQCPKPNFKEGCDPATCVDTQDPTQSRCQSFTCTGRDGQPQTRSQCPCVTNDDCPKEGTTCQTFTVDTVTLTFCTNSTCTYETADDVCCGRGARGEKPARDEEEGDEPIRRFRDGGRVGRGGRGGRRGGRRGERDERDGK